MHSKRILFLFFAIISGLIACKKEEISGPSIINITNTTIYDRLPAGVMVGILSTDVDDQTTVFRLVEGEGSQNNHQFEIKGIGLTTKEVLQYGEGSTRSVRIQATNGSVSYEQEIVISLNEFVGEYPEISSPSFHHNEEMPREFGANHGNISPDLEIAHVPTNTTSMLLTMNDLDDGSSYHWAVWNIPTNRTRIFRGEQWGSNTVVGENNFGVGYVGPFPPSVHRYQITIYFLTENLSLDIKNYYKLPSRIAGKVIAQASIVGKYRP